jgi:hypothetical protein
VILIDRFRSDTVRSRITALREGLKVSESDRGGSELYSEYLMLGGSLKLLNDKFEDTQR